MDPRSGHGPTQYLRWLGGAALVAIVAAACVTEAGSGTASPSPTIRTLAQTEVAPTVSPAQTPEPAVTPTPVASPVAPTTPKPTPKTTPPARTPRPTAKPSRDVYESLPRLGSLPDGRWTSIRWIPAAGPETGRAVNAENHFQYFSTFGWNGGFVAFFADQDLSNAASKVTISTSTSVDGLRWTNGRQLTAPKGYGMVAVTDLRESPAGLLALGQVLGITCGGPQPYTAMWFSADGATWQAIDVKAAFGGGQVMSVSGGPGGFAATGTVKDQNAIWLSSNGTAWQKASVPELSQSKLVLGDAVAFGGGYALSGAVLAPQDGCGGPSLMTPSLWWSASGTSWTRSAVPGVSPATTARMSLAALGEDALLAVQQSYDAATDTYLEAAWTSSDGKTWTKTSKDVARWAVWGRVVSFGNRSLIVPAVGDDQGKFDVYAFDSSLHLTKLALSGKAPGNGLGTWPSGATFGPTGVLVCANQGSSCWIGVPG